MHVRTCSILQVTGCAHHGGLYLLFGCLPLYGTEGLDAAAEALIKLFEEVVSGAAPAPAALESLAACFQIAPTGKNRLLSMAIFKRVSAHEVLWTAPVVATLPNWGANCSFMAKLREACARHSGRLCTVGASRLRVISSAQLITIWLMH